MSLSHAPTALVAAPPYRTVCRRLIDHLALLERSGAEKALAEHCLLERPRTAGIFSAHASSESGRTASSVGAAIVGPDAIFESQSPCIGEFSQTSQAGGLAHVLHLSSSGMSGASTDGQHEKPLLY